jgi:hypothetical protein
LQSLLQNLIAQLRFFSSNQHLSDFKNRGTIIGDRREEPDPSNSPSSPSKIICVEVDIHKEK